MEKEKRQFRVGIFPGSFDPITIGHIDLIRRAGRMVDVLYVSVLNNCNKKSLFTIEQRIHMITSSLEEYGISGESVLVESFDGMLVDYAAAKNCSMIIRGLRSVKDFDYELPIAQMNRRLDSSIETCFLAALPEYADLSSSAVKEVAMYHKSIHGMVPECIEEMVMKAVCF